MREQREEFCIESMCRLFSVSRSGYYDFLQRGPSQRKQEDDRLKAEIKICFDEGRETYGARRIKDSLNKQGKVISRLRTARLMAEQGLEVKTKKKFKATTDSKHNLRVAENLLNREFLVEEPDKVYGSDITYIGTDEGWLYLAITIDLYARLVVGWSMSSNMKAELVVGAMEMAYRRRLPEAGVIAHSDRGSQYASDQYQQFLAEHGIVCSMSRKGNCWDNAPIESFFHTLKTELIYCCRFKTRQEAMDAIFEYIEVFYNRQRKHSTLGYMSPADYEAAYYQGVQGEIKVV